MGIQSLLQSGTNLICSIFFHLSETSAIPRTFQTLCFAHAACLIVQGSADGKHRGKSNKPNRFVLRTCDTCWVAIPKLPKSLYIIYHRGWKYEKFPAIYLASLGSANSFCQRLDIKHFQLFRTFCLCIVVESSPSQYINNQAWLYSTNTLLIDTKIWIAFNFHVMIYYFVGFFNYLKM